MLKFKKALLILLAAILCIAMLAACGETKKKSSRRNRDDDEEEATATATDDYDYDVTATPTATAKATAKATPTPTPTANNTNSVVGTWKYKECTVTLENATNEQKQAIESYLDTIIQSADDTLMGSTIELTSDGKYIETVGGQKGTGTWRMSNGTLYINSDGTDVECKVTSNTLALVFTQVESGVTIICELVYTR